MKIKGKKKIREQHPCCSLYLPNELWTKLIWVADVLAEGELIILFIVDIVPTICLTTYMFWYISESRKTTKRFRSKPFDGALLDTPGGIIPSDNFDPQ